MTDIGRKIYYELSAGNVILDTGERTGDVTNTTEAQDFQLYTALQKYQQSAVGVLKLSYGQDSANFGKYPYSVDITQTPPVIKWDTSATDLADAQTQKKAQLDAMYQQTLASGFTSSANGTNAIYPYRPVPDQLNYNKIATNILLGKQTYPFNVTDVNGKPQAFTTQVQFEHLATDAGTFDWAQANQLTKLNGQVDLATTVADVNAIQWTPATY